MEVTWKSAREMGIYFRAARHEKGSDEEDAEEWVDCSPPPMALRNMVEQSVREHTGILGRYALCDPDDLLVDADEDALAPLSRFDLAILAIHSTVLYYGGNRETIRCTGSIGGVRGFDSDTAWPRILPRGWRRGLTYKSGDKEFTLRYSLRGDNTCVVTANDFQEAVFCIKKVLSSIQSAVRGDLDECLQSLSIASGEALADEVNDRVLSLLMFPDRAGQSSSLPKSSSDPEKTKAEPKAEPKCTSKAKLKKPKIGMSIPYPNPSRVPPQPFPQSIGGIGGFADDLLPGWPRHGRKPPWTRASRIWTWSPWPPSTRRCSSRCTLRSVWPKRPIQRTPNAQTRRSTQRAGKQQHVWWSKSRPPAATGV